MSDVGIVTRSTSFSKPLILFIGDDVKLLVRVKRNRILVSVEAPKSKEIRPLKDIEKLINFDFFDKDTY